MKRFPYLSLSLIIIGLTVISCHFSNWQFNNRKFLKQISNAEYKIEDQVIELHNGYYLKDILPGSASKHQVCLSEWLVLGDLNSDQKPDAAVILTSNYAGTGTFYYLVPVIRESDAPFSLEAILLGDRISMVSLKIDNQQIEVVYLNRDIDKSMTCAPTKEIQRQFIINDNTVSEINEVIISFTSGNN